jgi:AbiTii
VKLTADKISALPTPASGQRKVFDGDGLYLLLSHTEAKGWRLKYRYAVKEAMRGVLGRIRTIVLEWSLKLEKAGVVGENMTFSPEERGRRQPYISSLRRERQRDVPTGQLDHVVQL